MKVVLYLLMIGNINTKKTKAFLNRQPHRDLVSNSLFRS